MLNHLIIENKLNKNAKKIAQIDFIYQEIANRMINRLDYIKLQPDVILDIGYGLGIDSNGLLKKYSKAILYEVDIAVNMLKLYRQKQNLFKKLFNKKSYQICADGLSLPILSQSVNLVWSNLVLPYINDIEGFFKEVRRVLKVGGTFLVAGLGVDSLQQLREVGLNTYNFPDMHLIGDILVKLRFSDPVTDIDYITLEYDNFEQLLGDIRLIGCGAIINKNHLSKANYRDLANKFAKITKNGKNPLTLEIFYAHAWKDKVILDLVDDKKLIQFYPPKR